MRRSRVRRWRKPSRSQGQPFPPSGIRTGTAGRPREQVPRRGADPGIQGLKITSAPPEAVRRPQSAIKFGRWYCPGGRPASFFSCRCAISSSARSDFEICDRIENAVALPMVRARSMGTCTCPAGWKWAVGAIPVPFGAETVGDLEYRPSRRCRLRGLPCFRRARPAGTAATRAILACLACSTTAWQRWGRKCSRAPRIPYSSSRTGADRVESRERDLARQGRSPARPSRSTIAGRRQPQQPFQNTLPAQSATLHRNDLPPISPICRWQSLNIEFIWRTSRPFGTPRR